MDNAHKIKIMIVDDHPIFRTGLKMALRYSGVDCEVVAEAESVLQSVEYLKAQGPDIDLLMLDFFLTDGTAYDVLKAVETYRPGLKVLLLSGEVLPPKMMAQMQGRIDGFIGKSVKPDEMKRHIEALFGSRGDSIADSDELSEREIEVVRLCAKGLSAREIGEKLYIGKRTVETHKERIFLKLGLKSTKELINYAFRHGLIE